MADPHVRRALPALLLGAVAIASAPVLVRLAETGPTVTAFYRMLFAVPLLGAVRVVAQRRADASPPKALGWADLGRMSVPGLLFAGDLFVWHRSIHYTTVANATLLANFAPILVTLVAWAAFGERVTRAFVVGLALALLGTTILMGESLQLRGDHLLGDGLGLVTAGFYASYQLSIKRLRARYDAAQLMLWSSAACAAALLPLSLISGESLVIGSMQALAAVLALAAMTHVLGQGLVAWSFAHLPASFGSATLLLQPLGATVLAWLLLGEALGPWQALGGAVVLVGLFIARRYGGGPA